MKMYYRISTEHAGAIVPFAHVHAVNFDQNGANVFVGDGNPDHSLFLNNIHANEFIEQYTKWLDAQGEMFDATNALTNIAIVSARANIAVAEKALGGTNDSTNP